jgi:hypothetical protein
MPKITIRLSKMKTIFKLFFSKLKKLINKIGQCIILILKIKFTEKVHHIVTELQDTVITITEIIILTMHPWSITIMISFKLHFSIERELWHNMIRLTNLIDKIEIVCIIIAKCSVLKIVDDNTFLKNLINYKVI